MQSKKPVQRIPVGTEVEWTFCGQGIVWRKGRVVAFVPAGESAYAHIPEGAKRTNFADRSTVDRYIVAVEETARVKYGQREQPKRLREPLYCAPNASTVEYEYGLKMGGFFGE